MSAEPELGLEGAACGERQGDGSLAVRGSASGSVEPEPQPPAQGATEAHGEVKVRSSAGLLPRLVSRPPPTRAGSSVSRGQVGGARLLRPLLLRRRYRRDAVMGIGE